MVLKSTFETGRSDHHHLVYFMLKTCFKGEELKHFIYRDFKSVNNPDFRIDLENKLEECPKNYISFEKTFVNFLDAHTPRKTKVLRGNHKPMLIRTFVKPL